MKTVPAGAGTGTITTLTAKQKNSFHKSRGSSVTKLVPIVKDLVPLK